MQYQLAPLDRHELESAISSLLAEHRSIAQLDLVGFSNQDCLLTIGTWPIDAEQRKPRALFRELTEQRVLERLGVQHLRLYGCLTATTPRGRNTLATLSDMLGLEVTGTTELVCAPSLTPALTYATLDATLAPTAAPARTPGASHTSAATFTPERRSLDLDALPREHTRPGDHVTTTADAHRILQLVDRNAGRELPRLLALPHHTLTIASSTASAITSATAVHRLELLLDFTYLRVAGNLVFPVIDPHALRALVAN